MGFWLGHLGLSKYVDRMTEAEAVVRRVAADEGEEIEEETETEIGTCACSAPNCTALSFTHLSFHNSLLCLAVLIENLGFPLSALSK